MTKYNNKKWTQARFNSFIKNALRSASIKWPPRYECKKAAWVSRGKYRCIGYKKRSHIVPTTLPRPENKKSRIVNIQVDHIVPVIDSREGFVSWDRVIERLFCEKEGLQLLCLQCHSEKSKDERK